MKIKKGDKVIVISGKCKGQSGLVKKVFPKDEKVIVEGVNVFKRHDKKSKNPKEKMINVCVPIHVSKVAFFDEKTKKKCKIGYKIVNGIKVRVNKKTNEEIKTK